MNRLPQDEIDRFREALAAAYDVQHTLIERARTGEITMDQLHELSREIDWPRWSRHTLGPCMEGCVFEHTRDDAHEEVVSHERFVALIPTAQPGTFARVWWGFCDNLPDGTRSMPEVMISDADEGLTPEGARLLADAIVQAAAMVEAWHASESGQEPSR